MRNRVVVGLLILLLGLAGWGPARAQDTELSEDELALLDRIFAARAELDTYGTYVEEGSGTETQKLTLVLNDQAIELNESTQWQRTQTVINAEDGKNVDARLSALVEGEDWPVYRVNAEARYVAGKLYVSATYEDPGEELLPPLPEGWIAVEDTQTVGGDYPALAALQLDGMVDDEPSPLLDDQEMFRSTASEVSLQVVTLDDGTPADLITVLFGRDAVLSIVTEDTEDPFDLALFGALSDASQATLAVVMDADNQPLQVRTEFFMAVEEMDATTLSPEDFPAGSTLSFSYAGVQEQRYSQVNESFEPVAAPEELVATPAS